MGFDIFKGETSISDLVKRLFNLQEQSSDTAVKQLEDALLKANPQLKDISKVPTGSIITIPDTVPQAASAQPLATPDLLRAFAADRAQKLRTSLQQRLAKTSARGAQATNAILALTQSKDLQSAAEKNADLKRSLTAAVEAATARLKLIQTQKKTQ